MTGGVLQMEKNTVQTNSGEDKCDKFSQQNQIFSCRLILEEK